MSLINREDLIAEYDRVHIGKPGGARKLMLDAPEVQTEPQWIPCSETVDIPGHEIMACDKYGEIMFGYLAYEDEQWLCASDGCMMYDPIAWSEKPEPYREGNRNESKIN